MQLGGIVLYESQQNLRLLTSMWEVCLPVGINRHRDATPWRWYTVDFTLLVFVKKSIDVMEESPQHIVGDIDTWNKVCDIIESEM